MGEREESRITSRSLTSPRRTTLKQKRLNGRGVRAGGWESSPAARPLSSQPAEAERRLLRVVRATQPQDTPSHSSDRCVSPGQVPEEGGPVLEGRGSFLSAAQNAIGAPSISLSSRARSEPGAGIWNSLKASKWMRSLSPGVGGKGSERWALGCPMLGGGAERRRVNRSGQQVRRGTKGGCAVEEGAFCCIKYSPHGGEEN